MRTVWSEANATPAAAKARKRKIAVARAAFKQLVGREPTDDAELDAFVSIQARGGKVTRPAFRRELLTREARHVKAMVRGINRARQR